MAGVRSYKELDAWKLSVELRDGIINATQQHPSGRHSDFCEQVRSSARSAASNIAEGFGAYKPREFARFTRIARRSLMETENHLLEAEAQHYFDDHACRNLLATCRRALGATTRLLRYLDGCKGKAPSDWEAEP